MALLSINADAKTIKGVKQGYLTAVMYLAPSDESGVTNTCAMASDGCRKSCLFTAGRGRFDSTRNARIKRTVNFVEDKEAFLKQLVKELNAFIRKAKRMELTPCIRLNGTSDILWEYILYDGKCIIDHFPDVQWYDYTKVWKRFDRPLPKNYHLTFSRSEDNQDAVERVIEKHPNVNVAVVFDKLPETYLGRKVFNADDSDLRFLDPKGVICGLVEKGDAKKDESGFVVRVA